MTRGQTTSLGALLAAFGVSRLLHLTLLPMFIDEAIYLHWARRLATEGRLWRPLADGKSLQVVFLSVVIPWVRDPLFCGRALSVVVGAFGMLSAWAIGRRLHDARSGVFAAALYLACPFALLHDRMVLADVFLSTAAALALLAGITVAQAPSRRMGVLLGFAMAACALSKIPGLLAWAGPALAVVLLPRRPGSVRALVLAYFVATAIAVIPVAYFFQHSAQVQEQAALGEDEEARPAQAAANIATVAGWLWTYWTPGVFAVALVSLARALWRRDGAGMLLGGAALVPIVAFAVLSRAWFPRYVFFSTIPVLVLVGIAFSRFAGQVRGFARSHGAWMGVAATGLVALAVLGPAVDFDRRLLTDPASAPFPDVDRFQYVEGWPSGYGRAQTASRLRDEAARSRAGILVGVGGAQKHGWRPLYLLLRAELMNEPRAELQVLDPGDPLAREALVRRAGERAAFLAVAVDGGLPPVPGAPALREVRADGRLATALYRLLSQDRATQ
jgi:hypothetical protein